MIFGPNFRKNQLCLYSIYVPYNFLFHLYYIQDDEHSNTIEKFHVFLLSNGSFRLRKVLILQQQIQHGYEKLVHLLYRVIKLQQLFHPQLYLVKP